MAKHEAWELKLLTKIFDEDQKKVLQNRLIEVFTEEVKEELRCSTNYLVDFESIFAEVEEQVRDDLKEILYDEYMERAKSQIQKMFPAEIDIEDFMEYCKWFKSQHSDMIISSEALKAPIKLGDFHFRLEDEK